MKKLLEKKKREESALKSSSKMLDLRNKDSKKDLVDIKAKTSDLRVKNMAETSEKKKNTIKSSKNNSNQSNNSFKSKSISAFNSSDSDSFNSEKPSSKKLLTEKRDKKKKCLFFCF